ncbi:MAG: hypothetical protein RLZZ326_4031, partial [Planctomycetota bacterium]
RDHLLGLPALRPGLVTVRGWVTATLAQAEAAARAARPSGQR